MSEQKLWSFVIQSPSPFDDSIETFLYETLYHVSILSSNGIGAQQASKYRNLNANVAFRYLEKLRNLTDVSFDEIFSR